MELHWSWSPGRIQGARDGFQVLSFSGIGAAPDLAAASGKEVSTDTTNTVLYGSKEWKAQLRARHMFRNFFLPLMKGKLGSGSEGSGPDNWLRFRYFLDDSLAEYRDGEVGGPAFGGKFLLQRPPGAVPERMEIAPPFCHLSDGAERWERARFMGKVALMFSFIYTSIDFARNQYRHYSVVSAVERRECQADDPSNGGETGFVRDNLLFRKYREFRENRTGKKYNWRKSLIPFIGFQMLCLGFVAPFSIWGTWFFCQHAYSSFFVTFSFNLALWHDLFYL